MRILGISGSLRAGSSNTVLLQAAVALAPAPLKVVLFDRLAEFPHFNPDLDREPFPAAVLDFRAGLRKSAGVLISCPEYAHGVPGVLKNALDWLVASGELYEKPVALFNASPRGTYAQASLAETLAVMTARLVPEASLTVTLSPQDADPRRIASDPHLSVQIRRALAAFALVMAPASPRVEPSTAA